MSRPSHSAPDTSLAANPRRITTITPRVSHPTVARKASNVAFFPVFSVHHGRPMARTRHLSRCEYAVTLRSSHRLFSPAPTPGDAHVGTFTIFPSMTSDGHESCRKLIGLLGGE